MNKKAEGARARITHGWMDGCPGLCEKEGVGSRLERGPKSEECQSVCCWNYQLEASG